ncbi:aldo/keto reductase [Chitinophaga pinensis]|uniref:aldo/keto reductase n=1 Tax=Chitinophaga pinensis TaxID=79329 RepID=UPI0021BD8613|nr:aldo/keto reductase [Chitinophaga pinensis]
MVSVHDPDEYLFTAVNDDEREERYQDILAAYQSLHQLKKDSYVTSVGIGSKDWRTIQRISNDVDLDWVMFANSLTIYQQPPALLTFVAELAAKGVHVINSAVFHGGFLTGSDYFDYKPVSREHPAHQQLYMWRDQLYKICREFEIDPAAACIRFAMSIPGVSSIALNSTSPQRTKRTQH